MQNWMNRRVLIIGAARQGLALARYLVHQGAKVTLNDKRTVEQMQPVMDSLQELAIHWVLGDHPLTALDEQDIVCLSGGIPLTLPIVQEAERRGLLISNDSEIFMEAVPCKVIGITGSAGKTTTTTLVGRMAEAAVCCPHKAWIGGNIGLPLVEYLDQIQPSDLVILELSSFQLEQMTHSPYIGAILNITPNHLDRHGTLEAYTAAKARLLDFQSPTDIAILNRDDAGSWNLSTKVHGKLVSFGFNHPPAGIPGTYAQDGWICWYDGETDIQVLPQELILLRGDHNIANVLAACAVAFAAKFPVEAMWAGIQNFKGVFHRLELVRSWNGVRWYNDSIATAPERTSAAVRAFTEPIVLMLGGRDKNLPWEDLAALIRQRVDHVIVFGEASEKIMTAIGPVIDGQRPHTVDRCAGLAEAVEQAAKVCTAGDVVLLSPGGTSFDQFKDFEERGEIFKKWVNQLP